MSMFRAVVWFRGETCVAPQVLFGKDDMPMDYKKPADVGGLSSADVKKIMAKKERKAGKGKGK